MGRVESLEARVTALEESNDILNLAPDGELGNALRITGASANEAASGQYAVRHLVFNRPRAGSLCGVGFHVKSHHISSLPQEKALSTTSPMRR